MIKISKSKFFNLLRCNRFCALDELKFNKNNPNITYNNMTIEELYKNYKDSKKIETALSVIEDDEFTEENITEFDMQTITFADQYTNIELYAAHKLKNIFKNASFKYGQSLKDQFYSETRYKGYNFYCFTDIYIETDDKIIIVEVKAMTDRKYKIISPQNPYYQLYDGVLYNIDDLKSLSIVDSNTKATAKPTTLCDPFHDNGRPFYDISIQRFINEHNKNFNPLNKHVEYYIACLNSDYIYDGKLDKNGNHVYSDDLITIIYATRISNILQSTIANDIDIISKRLDNMDINPCNITKNCLYKKIRECPYFHKCLKDLNFPEQHSIFEYKDRHLNFNIENKSDIKKNDIYEILKYPKYKHMLDLTEEELVRAIRKTQRETVETGKPFIAKDCMKSFLDSIKYPIYHLDFESLPSPLPRFKDEKCYQQSLFQFSIHIEKEPGKCDLIKDNISFLSDDSTKDCREELCKELINTIKDDEGTILVYNQNFEKSRFKELIEYAKNNLKNSDLYINKFNDWNENRILDLLFCLNPTSKFIKQLELISKNIIDIADTMLKYGTFFYHKNLYGSYSIKKVLPIFTTLSYNDLEVQNGVMAYNSYLKLNTLDTNEKHDLYNNMLKYCMQDTYSMFLILDKIRGIVNNNENI